MSMPKKDSLELLVLELVSNHYPITKDELRRRLGVSPMKLELALKRLVKDGFVEFDVLPDKVFVRLKVIISGPQARKKHKKEKTRQERGSAEEGHSGHSDDYSYM
jgi:DNA-binding MarR family transcriptional regulator